MKVAEKERVAEAKALRVGSWKKDFCQNRAIYLVFLPVFIYFFVFSYLPMFGIVMSFQNYNVRQGIFHSQWVGMENFVRLFTGAWQSFGYGSIIFVGAICNVSDELYEAASLDGADRWRQIINITLPSIKPTVIMMLILQIGTMFRAGFDRILLLYMPSTYAVSDTIFSYTYRQGNGTMEHAYDTPGTHFAAVRVSIQRDGKDDIFTQVRNLDRARVVVE